MIARRLLESAADIGAVLINRLQKATQPQRGRRRREPRLIAGLIPIADGPMNQEMTEALTERADLMEARAIALAEQAADANAPWLRRLGPPPTSGAARRRWLHEVRTVAAYRDRYRIDVLSALGEPRTEAQKLDAVRAEQAIHRAQAITDHAASSQDGRSRTLEPDARALR